MEARCECGALRVALPGPSEVVVACHCLDCQRRTGAPFGVGAYYEADAVTITGEAREYVRPTASGGSFRQGFCPTCGSTLWWVADNRPTMIGVAVGAIGDPDYPPPVRSVWEGRMHRWVSVDVAAQHFPEGRR